MYVCGQNKIESYFSDRLTFSNIRGRTSRRMYRLALPLLSPETLSSSSKTRIFLYNAHLALFVRMDDTITHTNASISSKVSKRYHLPRLAFTMINYIVGTSDTKLHSY